MKTKSELMAEHKARCEAGTNPAVSAFPIVARGVFGPSPGEIIDDTSGRIWQFYYIYLIALVWFKMFEFMILEWLEVKTDPLYYQVATEFLGADDGNWMGYSLAAMHGLDILQAVCLRPVLYPKREDGSYHWRWSK